jgi:hypothetical protein
VNAGRPAIAPTDLLPLRIYNLHRTAIRQRLIAYKRARTVELGPSMRLQFEDALTVRYQVQEAMRAESIEEPARVEEELASYMQLLPDGRGWRATLMIELPDARQRRSELAVLSTAAHEIFLDVLHHPRLRARVNEDLPDRHLTRPSAVHFLRFEMPGALRAALLDGAQATLGCAHRQYEWRCSIASQALALLRHDLAPTRGMNAGAVSPLENL